MASGLAALRARSFFSSISLRSRFFTVRAAAKPPPAPRRTIKIGRRLTRPVEARVRARSATMPEAASPVRRRFWRTAKLYSSMALRA